MHQVFLYKTSSGREIIAEFIDNLDEITRGRVRNSIRVLEKHGLELLKNQSVKKVARKPDIFELRTVGEKQIRIFFALYESGVFILLHIIVKKSQKTLVKEIKLAQKRANEFI